MSETEKPEQNAKTKNNKDVITDLDIEAEPELPSMQPGLGERVRKVLNNLQQRGPQPKQELAKDRTRPLALLIAGTVGAVLLFIGVFSTPTPPVGQQPSSRVGPNSGRVAAPIQSVERRSSVTPLLNADVRTDDGNPDQLSPADIQGTSNRASSDDMSHVVESTPERRISRASNPTARNSNATGSLSNNEADPLAAYRLSRSGTPTYSYGSQPVDSPQSRTPGSIAVPVAVENRRDAPASTKSSIVFMRSTEPAPQGMRQISTAPLEQASLLPPGTRLIARLEAAATSVLKAPVVASIEYNYERDGLIMVPAGTKVFGDLQQASSDGYLSIRFHTLRMPDGHEETIEGAGVSLDHKPLKGQVSGTNTGKKLLSRTLSGAGTVAAYVVGAGGAGLTRTITGGTLLRDRLASNIALAGEQELTNAAYSQNITVTLPANTRFYVVLQKPANTMAPTRTVESARVPVEIPTVQELRELMDLRREINRTYEESNANLTGRTRP